MRVFRSLNIKTQSLTIAACAFVSASFGPYAHAAKEAGEKEIEGLPQLDFSTYASQIFWMFAAFVILYIFFSKKTLPEVSGVIESRREQVEGDLDNAQRLKEEAETAQAAYEKALADARQQASALMKKSEDDIKALTQKRTDALKADAAKKIEKTEKAVEDAKKAAIAETHSVAAEIASIAAEKIVGVSTDIKKAQTLVDTIGRKAA